MPLSVSVRAAALLVLAAAPFVTHAASSPVPREVVASRFKFDPEVIEAVEGERVTLSVRSADGVHGFAIKKLKVKAAIPRGGQPVTVEFTAPAPGEYEITCSEYCGSGHKRMRGRLVVRPRAD